MLKRLLDQGFEILGTWPMRTELANRTIASGANALASSIVLVCRPRSESAPAATFKQFQTELARELPPALGVMTGRGREGGSQPWVDPIAQLGGALLREPDVAGLQVAVDDAAGVGVLQRLAHLAQYADGLVDG